jgi:hypothetical protein
VPERTSWHPAFASWPPSGRISRPASAPPKGGSRRGPAGWLRLAVAPQRRRCQRPPRHPRRSWARKAHFGAAKAAKEVAANGQHPAQNGGLWHTRPARLPATYHRTQGVRYLHACYSFGDGQLWGVMRARKGAGHTLAALKSIRAGRPDGYWLHVILDNLSANKTPAIQARAERANVELCLTPTNASWANPIGPQFGPIRTVVMGGSDYRNHSVLARRMQDYLCWRNASARHPDVLAAQRRERAASAASASNAWGRPRPSAAA